MGVPGEFVQRFLKEEQGGLILNRLGNGDWLGQYLVRAGPRFRGGKTKKPD